jgi:hypothetical protein
MSFFASAVNAAAAPYNMSVAGTPAANKAALQAALNTGKHVFVPHGGYWNIEVGLEFKNQGQRLYGAGQSSTHVRVHGAGPFIRTASMPFCRLEGFTFVAQDGAVITHTAGAVLMVEGGPAYSGNPNQNAGTQMDDVTLDGHALGVSVTDHNSLMLDDVWMANMRGPGVHAFAADANARVDVVSLKRFSYSGNAALLAADAFLPALWVDGCVHTTVLYEFRAHMARHGILVQNSFGLPWGQFPAFVFGRGVEIDFPRHEAISIGDCDRARFTDLYAHGSSLKAGIAVAAGCRDFKLIAANVTGHYKNGLWCDANRVDLHACEFEWNSQEAAGLHASVVLGANARNVRVVGGGDVAPSSALAGIQRLNPATQLLVSAFEGTVV